LWQRNVCRSANAEELKPPRLIFVGLTVLGFLTAKGAEHPPSYVPPPFGCELRLFFRELIPSAAPGEKWRSAPDFERESLPGPRWKVIGSSATRYVEGVSRTLGLRIRVEVTRSTANDPGTMIVAVVRRADGKSIQGFPKNVENAISKLKERTSIRIDMSEELKSRLSKRKGTPKREWTAIYLVIGEDVEPNYQQ
jgi:hypothetical protein